MMTKVRVLVFLSTLIIVGIFGTFAVYYARGYRFSFKNMTFAPSGILALKSEPDGASIYINGDLRGATNTNLNIAPGTYDVEIKKEGFLPWKKRLVIDKEIVTSANVSLFKNVPSLSPLTFNGAVSPVISHDNSRIVYMDNDGVWIIDIFSLPIGFAREPRKITDAKLTNANLEFSPDGKEILLNTTNGVYLLSTGSFISQNELVNVAQKKDSIIADWEKENLATLTSLLNNLPQEFQDVFLNKTSSITFSPDETMILYTASSSATLPENLIPQLPGSSTQKQERNIKKDQTYVYDIKEDRNFLLGDSKTDIKWMPGGRLLLSAVEGKVVIMDYDGTNKQDVYKGAYLAPFAFPYTNSSKIIVLTSLGDSSSLPNLYSISIK